MKNVKLPSQQDEYTFLAKSLVPKTTPLQYTELYTPIVEYTSLAWNKIQYLVQTCEKEVGWLGTVQETDTGYLIEDIYVPEQTVTGAETDIEAAAMVELAMILDDPDTLYYWGHSHVSMGVCPSAQDENQTAEYLNHLTIFIRGIYNKHGASKVDVFDTDQMVVHECVQNAPEVPPLTAEQLLLLDEDLKNVKEKVYRQANANAANKGYNSSGGYNYAGSGGYGSGAMADMDGYVSSSNRKSEVSSIVQRIGSKPENNPFLLENFMQ